MLTALPALKRLTFRGVVAYLESLVARIRAPLLERFNVTLFYELIFTLPHLFKFLKKTEGIRHPVSKVIFNREAVAFVIGPRDEFIDGTFSLRISCKPFDWQIDSATQVCTGLAPVLSVVEELALEFDEQSLPENWRNEVDGIEAWHGILWPFGCVKKLHIRHPLALEFSRALESNNVGIITVLLPELQELQAVVEARQEDSAFSAFIDARRDAGRPVHLRVSVVSFAPDEYPLIPDEYEHKLGQDKDSSIPYRDPLVTDALSSSILAEHPSVHGYPTASDSLSAPVQRNWFRRAVVDRARRRLIPRIIDDDV
jgi:hypothetical protein